MPLLDPYYLAVMGVLGASSKRRALASPPPVLLVLRPLFHSSAHSCTANLKLPLLLCLKIITTTVTQSATTTALMQTQLFIHQLCAQFSAWRGRHPLLISFARSDPPTKAPSSPDTVGRCLLMKFLQIPHFHSLQLGCSSGSTDLVCLSDGGIPLGT